MCVWGGCARVSACVHAFMCVCVFMPCCGLSLVPLHSTEVLYHRDMSHSINVFMFFSINLSYWNQIKCVPLQSFSHQCILRSNTRPLLSLWDLLCHKLSEKGYGRAHINIWWNIQLFRNLECIISWTNELGDKCESWEIEKRRLVNGQRSFFFHIV